MPPNIPIIGLSGITDMIPGKINAPNAAYGTASNHLFTQLGKETLSTIKTGIRRGSNVTIDMPIMIVHIIFPHPPLEERFQRRLQ